MKNRIALLQGKRKRNKVLNLYRKQITNNDFSIICSNCIGGIIYHLLGMEFLSPTINLWIPQNEFLKMIMNLRNYMEKELYFLSGEDYPVALLGDVHIHFNHYHSNEEAEEAWNKRKSRINYDNLWVIMYERDGISEIDIEKIKQISCRGFIVLTEKQHLGTPYVTLKPSDDTFDTSQCVDRDEYGVYAFEKQFDFVYWLNTGDIRYINH